MENKWGEEMSEKELEAYLRGYAMGMELCGPYTRGLNPYTSYAIGVKSFAAFRMGYETAYKDKQL